MIKSLVGKYMLGQIGQIEIGQTFESRRALADAGLHAPLMAGIWGAQKGAYSIVLSGGYEDDKDDLDYILYTGQGGQDAPGGKQIADQEFKKGNRGLQLSFEYGLPVRVIRGHQVENGPPSGYRYDGLYKVVSYERVHGKSGFYICRFHLVSELTFDLLQTSLMPFLKPGYKKTSRTTITVNKLQRNVELSEKVKSLHSYKCQICGVTLETPKGPIAIGAHIMGLGQPHNGPDVLENMLCLCPNHHDQFDRFSYYIEPSSLDICGLKGFESKRLKIHSKHKIYSQYFEYHKRQYDKVNR